MVFVSGVHFRKTWKPMRKYLMSSFRDTLKVIVTGGTGGNGLPKFGGIGGPGGNVIAVGVDRRSLHEVYKQNKSKIYKAQNGMNSSHNFILGQAGQDLKFEVPTGVTIITELGKRLGEINTAGEEILLAKGGTGGNPKNGFLGTNGQSYPVIFDLKLIADFGLVGFPNAGKSTLLKGISHAKPKIASYPFTTVRPNLGIVKFKDFRQFSIADLPGLIEGAYANKGMGHRFLKHVERTKALLLIVDINGFQLSPDYPHRSCLETIFLLNRELELYNEELIQKPAILLINKMDTEKAEEQYNSIKPQLSDLKGTASNYPEEMQPENMIKFTDIIPISAKESSADLNLVKERLRHRLDILAMDPETDNTYTDLKEKQREKGPKLI